MVSCVMSFTRFVSAFVFIILCASGVWSYAASASKILPPTPSATRATLERGNAVLVHSSAVTSTLGADVALTPGDAIETGPEGRVFVLIHGATMLLLDADARLVVLRDDSFPWPPFRSHAVLALEHGRVAWFSAHDGSAHRHVLETATARLFSASSTNALAIVRADRIATRITRPGSKSDDPFAEEARAAAIQFQNQQKNALREAFRVVRARPGTPAHWLLRLGERMRIAATSDRATRIVFRHALIERRFIEWLDAREHGSARAQERALRELEEEKIRLLKEADGLPEASRDAERHALAAWERDDVPYALELLGISGSSENMTQTSGVMIEPYDDVRRYIPPPMFIAPIMATSTAPSSTVSS